MQEEPLQSPPPDTAPLAVAPLAPADRHPAADAEPHQPAASPAWANDLRKLYDAVVEEPLPDSLIDLLSQLDAED